MSPRRRSWIAPSTCLLLLTVFAACSAAATLEVGSGKTYATIQEAIVAASGGDEIVVSAGTYAECINFAGKSITVRSTDPANPAVVAGTVIDGGAAGSVVTFSSGEGASAVLTGLTITNGSGTLNSYGGFDGGGIYCSGSSPTITKNVIIGNSALGTLAGGGGIVCHSGASALIDCNVISNNTIGGFNTYGGGIACFGSNPTISGNVIMGNAAPMLGGGIYANQTSGGTISGNTIGGNASTSYGGGVCLVGSPTLSGNLITANTASTRGAGVYVNNTASPLIEGNTISGNTGASQGGGICSYQNSSSTVIKNNLIVGNSAKSGGWGGGGIHCYSSSATIQNNTIVSNSAAGAAMGGAGILCSGGSATIENNIIAGNVGGGGVYNYQASPSISYTNSFGNTNANYVGMTDQTGSNGNISVDPLFAGAGDYHLQSRQGRWTAIGWVQDASDSACIDAGNPSSAVGDEPAPNGGIINMGAYGGTAQASKTYTIPAPVLTELIPNWALVGSSAFTLTVKGTDFVSGAVVRWGGADRATTFISDTQLTAAIPASDLATAGVVGVTAFNPAPGGGESNSLPFDVKAPPSVVWVDDDWDGPGNCGGHIWQYDAFDVIQDGIDAVADGGTVNVAAGTYAENLAIAKALTLTGPNASIDPNTQTRVDEATVVGTITQLADNVTITGFTFTPVRYAICANAAAHIAVSFNRFIQCVTLYYADPPPFTDLSISNNLMSGSETYAMHVDSVDGAVISDNVMVNMRSGLDLWGVPECKNIDITGNTFRNMTFKGVNLAYTINNITISGNIMDSIRTLPGGSTASCVFVYGTDPAWPYDRTGPVTIADNVFTNCTRGIAVATGAQIDDEPFTVTGNQFDALNDWFIWHRGVGDITALKTSNTYGGTANDDAAIESKMYHDVDSAGCGHIDWGQGAATNTNLSVQNVSGAKGATVQLAARLTAGGSALAGQTVNISVAGTLVGSPVTDSNGWARIDYTITQDAGAFNIDAAFGGVFNYEAATGRGTLTVTTPAPTSITLTMNPDDILAGETSTATVMGNNGVDYSAAATCYIQYGAGGSWAGNVYTSAKAGTWTVTAVYGSLAATDALTVNHGPASSVILAPATASITTDQDQTYTVQATDAQGNSWTPAVGDIAWNHNGQGAFNGMIYEPDDLDGGNVVNITATVDLVASNAAALTVISSGTGGTPLILAWDRDTATFYLCTDAVNPQTGTALALGNNTVGTVTVTVAKTGSSSTDLFATVTNAGAPTNSLRVRWYLRSGAVDKCYSYSTIDGTTHTAVYSLGRTSIDGGRSQVGFFGLAHNLNADPPTGITYSVVQQP